MKTLMATDGSKEATTALNTAARLLRRSNNEIDLLCVGPELFPQKKKGRKGAHLEEYLRRIGLETKSILEQGQKVLNREGLGAKAISEIGSPAGTIVRLAEGYDVTVVGAKGRYTDSELGLGPVASRVVEYAPGTVLVARELNSEGNLRILLCVDGSLASKSAIRHMLSYFKLGSSEITLMHVIETPWIHLGLDREWFAYPEDRTDRSDPETMFEGEFQKEAEDLIEDARIQLDKYDLAIDTLVEEGNPATEILGEAEKGDYDLIILGATGLTDTKHNLLGSISSKVAWQAPCSVAVVKYSW
jgi:nucleotide-binding universal stress UspA family protein